MSDPITDFDAETDGLKAELKRERSINQWLRTKSAIREKLTNITMTHVAVTIAIFAIPATLIDLGLL